LTSFIEKSEGIISIEILWLCYQLLSFKFYLVFGLSPCD
jgi:hypothetical protein